MRRSRILIVAAATLAIAVVAIGAYALRNRTTDQTASSPVTSSSPQPSTSVSPTQHASASAKPTQAASVTPTAAPSLAPTGVTPVPSPTRGPSLATVDVLVTYADFSAADGVVEAAGYAAVVESGGVCTLTLTSGSHSATASISSTPDASTVNCGGLTIPRSELTSGTWNAVVSYTSATSAGASKAVEVVVP